MLYNKISFHSLTRHKNTHLRYLLQLIEHPTWLGKIFGKKARIRELVGSGTVWYFSPSGRRAGTMWESMIVNILKAAQIAGEIEDYY